jgi:hypothetical protein
LAAPLNLECETPSVAYLAVRRIGPTTPKVSSTGQARVIGDPMSVQSGGLGVYICSEGNREVLAPVSRDIHRGDLVPTSRKPGSSGPATSRPSSEGRKSSERRPRNRRKPI